MSDDGLDCTASNKKTEQSIALNDKNASIPESVTSALHAVINNENETVIYSDELGIGLGPMLSGYMNHRAFDCVHHETLIGKLRHYGVTGRALDLLKSYLSNRVQRVDVNGKKSSGSIVHMGVPQGSILGPFSLVYINDLPSLVKDAHEIVLFADDTSLLFKVKRQQPTYDDVNNAISKVEKWFTANNLLLNEMKTKCIRFSLPNVRHGSGTISVRNKELEFVNSTVFLGITLDDRLQWGPHISKLAKRLSSAAYAVKKMRNLSDVETARLVYFGCFHSLMSYGILLWETPGYSENFRVAEAGRSRNLQARTSYIP
ncbi:Probable RNA-directed DNA polymerase from transposon BS [Eumeta japonica]|uniref:Probable RNA-directed DNA polymerase from transposon BS n=1 Tax=Eumeta variegata TaxID=151549 RepID=A0A4C1YKS4_EUMVA|nr:Probable RNA-directed DNA polymerase from transposon BS [Eumeta japonica]